MVSARKDQRHFIQLYLTIQRHFKALLYILFDSYFYSALIFIRLTSSFEFEAKQRELDLSNVKKPLCGMKCSMSGAAKCIWRWVKAVDKAGRGVPVLRASRAEDDRLANLKKQLPKSAFFCCLNEEKEEWEKQIAVYFVKR